MSIPMFFREWTTVRPTVNASLSLLRYMESIGLRKVCSPPYHGSYPTPNKKLRQQLDVLKAAYSGPLDLRLSSEYMMDAAFTNKLDGEVLPLGSSHLLVETSYMYPPPGLPDILMKVWNAGYQPVIAHSERYLYMEEKDYLLLK